MDEFSDVHKRDCGYGKLSVHDEGQTLSCPYQLYRPHLPAFRNQNLDLQVLNWHEFLSHAANGSILETNICQQPKDQVAVRCLAEYPINAFGSRQPKG